MLILRKMKTSKFALILVLALAFLSSCVEQINPLPEVAPELPTAEMYTIPTEVLSDTSSATTQGTTAGATYKNFIHAGVHVLFWNTAIVANTAIPTAAFARALNENPTFIGNATFEWAYQYQGPFALYDVVLTGQYINNAQDVEWVMTLSKVGGFSNFEWYRGVVARDRSEANWTINHKPFNPEPYLSVEYNADASSADRSIRYTNINPSNNDIGGYIEYRIEPNNTFNRSYDISGGATNPAFIEIQWDEPSMEGRVKNSNFFNDNNWHCWDTNQADTDC